MTKSISNKHIALAVTGFTCILLIRCCIAGILGAGEPVYDYSNFIKNAATAKDTATMLTNQTEMLEMQVESMKHLRKFNYHDIAKVIEDIKSITEQGQALSYSMKKLDKEFTKRYPNYNSRRKLLGYKDAYTTWDETSLQTFQNTLQAIGVNSKDVKNHNKLLSDLKNQSNSAEGQTRLLQVSHALTINTNQNLITLQQIMSAQTNAQTTYMSHKVSKESYQQKSMDEVMENIAGDVPRVESGFGRMEFKAGHKH